MKKILYGMLGVLLTCSLSTQAIDLEEKDKIALKNIYQALAGTNTTILKLDDQNFKKWVDTQWKIKVFWSKTRDTVAREALAGFAASLNPWIDDQQKQIEALEYLDTLAIAPLITEVVNHIALHDSVTPNVLKNNQQCNTLAQASLANPQDATGKKLVDLLFPSKTAANNQLLEANKTLLESIKPVEALTVDALKNIDAEIGKWEKALPANTLALATLLVASVAPFKAAIKSILGKIISPETHDVFMAFKAFLPLAKSLTRSDAEIKKQVQDIKSLAAIDEDFEVKPKEEEPKKEKLEKDKLEKDKLEKDKLEKDKLEKDKLEKDKLEKDKLEKDKLEKDKLEKDKLEKDKLEKDKLEKDKLEKDKLAKGKLEKDKLEKDKLEKDKLAKGKKGQLPEALKNLSASFDALAKSAMLETKK